MRIFKNTIELLKYIRLALIVVKFIGTGIATTGLIGAGVGIGVVFGALILSVAIYSTLRGQIFSYAILGFAFTKAIRLFVFIMPFLFSTFDFCFDCHSFHFIADDELDPYNEIDKEIELEGLYEEGYEWEDIEDIYDYDSDESDDSDDSDD